MKDEAKLAKVESVGFLVKSTYTGISPSPQATLVEPETITLALSKTVINNEETVTETITIPISCIKDIKKL